VIRLHAVAVVAIRPFEWFIGLVMPLIMYSTGLLRSARQRPIFRSTDSSPGRSAVAFLQSDGYNGQHMSQTVTKGYIHQYTHPLLVLDFIIEPLMDDVLRQPLDTLRLRLLLFLVPSSYSCLVAKLHLGDSITWVTLLTMPHAGCALASTVRDAEPTGEPTTLRSAGHALQLRRLSARVGEFVTLGDSNAHEPRLDVHEEALDRRYAAGDDGEAKSHLSPNDRCDRVPCPVLGIGVVECLIRDKCADDERWYPVH